MSMSVIYIKKQSKLNALDLVGFPAASLVC